MALTEIIVDYAAGVGGALKHLFLGVGSFLSPAPVLVALAIAAVIVARRLRRDGEASNPSAIWRALFPAQIWRHVSARHDLFIIAINDGVLFFLPALAGGAVSIAAVQTARSLGVDFYAPAQTQPVWLIAFGIYMALAWDFLATYAHYLKHKVPILWEFHKVHHCAEVLTPLTAMRRHPFESVFSTMLITAGMITAISLWITLFGAPGSLVDIGGLAVIVYLWRLLGYNIRHSHIWISYGSFWNRYLMSPAHHQLHHSREARHHDCNFGHIFTFWDRLFGTLYAPVEGERFEFGIEAEENAKLNTLRALYLRPIRQAAARFAPPGELPPSRHAGASGMEN